MTRERGKLTWRINFCKQFKAEEKFKQELIHRGKGRVINGGKKKKISEEK